MPVSNSIIGYNKQGCIYSIALEYVHIRAQLLVNSKHGFLVSNDPSACIGCQPSRRLQGLVFPDLSCPCSLKVKVSSAHPHGPCLLRSNWVLAWILHERALVPGCECRSRKVFCAPCQEQVNRFLYKSRYLLSCQAPRGDPAQVQHCWVSRELLKLMPDLG